MNKILQLSIILIIAIFSQAYSQVIPVYLSGQRSIQNCYKSTLPNSHESFYIKLSPPSDYEPENVMRYNFSNSSLADRQHNGLFSTTCHAGQFGSECGSFIDFELSASDTNKLLSAAYAPFWEPAGAYVFSEDNGLTNRILFENDFIFQYFGMTFDPANDDIIYAGWRFLFTDSTKTLYKSIDNGLTWRGLSVIPLNANADLKVSPFNSSVIFYGFYNKILSSADGGNTFNEIGSNVANVYETVFDYANRQTYFVTSSGIYRTDSTGSSLTQICVKSFRTIKIDPSNSNIMYAGNGYGLFKSTDAGASWSLYVNTFTPSKNVIGLAKNPGMGDTVIAATTKGIYKVTGSQIADTVSMSYFPLSVGNKWVYRFYYLSFPTHQAVMKVISDSVINNKIYYKLTGSIIGEQLLRVDPAKGILYAYKPECPGSEEIIDSLSSNINDTARGCPAGEKKVLVDTGSISLFNYERDYKKFKEDYLVLTHRTYVRDFGIKHLSSSEPPPLTSYYELLGCVINNSLYGDTTVTHIGSNSNSFPEKFMLYQNYPNPFNPSTTISFDIPVKGFVTLKVYNVLGMEVKNLVNELLNGGTHEIEFNASGLSSGVYYYQMTAGNYINVRKMVVVK